MNGGDIHFAVVIGALGFGGLAFEQSHTGVNGILHQGAHIFENGHALLAVNNVLDGSLFGILTGDEIAGHVFVGGKGIGNCTGGAVIRGQDKDIALVLSRGGGQVGFGQVLGRVEIPVGGNLANNLGLFITR